jgi:hypothetical protein
MTFLSLKNIVNVPSKSDRKKLGKKLFFVGVFTVLKATAEKRRIRIRSDPDTLLQRLFVTVSIVRNKQKTLEKTFFAGTLKATEEKCRIRIWISDP